jgi:hypothetical protein
MTLVKTCMMCISFTHNISSDDRGHGRIAGERNIPTRAAHPAAIEHRNCHPDKVEMLLICRACLFALAGAVPGRGSERPPDAVRCQALQCN